MNIAQEDDSNIFKLFKNLWLNNLQFIILKCCRFYLFIASVFILLLLYTQTFLILYFLNTLLFQPPPPPPPIPTTISFGYFFQPAP